MQNIMSSGAECCSQPASVHLRRLKSNTVIVGRAHGVSARNLKNCSQTKTWQRAW